MSVNLKKSEQDTEFMQDFYCELLDEVDFWQFAVDVTPEGLQCREDFKERLLQAKAKLKLFAFCDNSCQTFSS